MTARFPTLAFVLTYGDSMESHGSYLLVGGAVRGHWDVPDRLARKVFWRNYRAHGLRSWVQVEAGNDEAFWAEADAGDELMDLAARHWDKTIAKGLQQNSKMRSLVGDRRPSTARPTPRRAE